MPENTQETTSEMVVRKPMRAVTRFASGGRRYPTLAFVIAILALTALSTHGTLDDFAGERLNETTVESLVVYGVVRAIDSTITVLMSVEVGPVVASIEPGQALNPVAESIDRFSTIMTWAIGSLLLQGVLLAFVSSTLFKWLFAAIAAVTFTALIIAWLRRSSGAPSIDWLNQICGSTVKIFILATIVRFIVPVFVLLSYLAGQALLQPEIDSRSAGLSAIGEEISGNEQQILDQLEIDETAITDLNGQSSQAGENAEGSIFDRIPDILPDLSIPDFDLPDFSSMIPNLLERAANLVEYMTRLLVLFVVKNIVLPLVFLAIALKVIKPVTMRLLAMTAAIDRDLNEIKGEMKQIGNPRSSRLPEPR